MNVIDIASRRMQGWTMDELHEVIRLTGHAGPEHSPRVDVIMMTGSCCAERATGALSSWGSDPRLGRVVLVSDVADPNTGAITMPILAGKSSYEDAQHRQLRYVADEKLFTAHAGADWILFVDDDSWVDVPNLLNFITQFDPALKLAFGHVWAPGHWRTSDVDFLSGGAGMLLTSAAISAVRTRLYTPLCPFTTANDVTLSNCLWSTRSMLVHSPAFSPMPPDSRFYPCRGASEWPYEGCGMMNRGTSFAQSSDVLIASHITASMISINGLTPSQMHYLHGYMRSRRSALRPAAQPALHAWRVGVGGRSIRVMSTGYAPSIVCGYVTC